MPKLASWNVNSLRVRLDQVLQWLDEAQVDVLALQETKMTDEDFPADAFLDRGFHVAFSGQKTYNGVALVSRQPMHDIVTERAGWPDPERRLIMARINDVQIINVYVPNGFAVDSGKYLYKLAWLDHMRPFIKSLVDQGPLAVVGDFNIAPEDDDVHDPLAWKNSVLVSPAERAAFSQLLRDGLIDSFRQHHPDERAFSWWDYRGASFRRDHGVRIDHILINSALAQRCTASGIDSNPRRHERPSDHAPVWITY